MSDEQDDLIARIAASLQPFPDVNGEARARVLVAVQAAREESRRDGRLAGRRSVAHWLLPAIGIAAAVVLLAVGVRMVRRDSVRPPTTTLATAAPQVPTTAATLAARTADAASAPLPVQLVFHSATAHRVTVAGDFTGWDASQVKLTRDPASGLWSVTVAVRPGRHVYAFVVDDSLWVRDPSAPVAPDADFGRPGSLLLVGRP
jgi:hypothetical protein